MLARPTRRNPEAHAKWDAKTRYCYQIQRRLVKNIFWEIRRKGLKQWKLTQMRSEAFGRRKAECNSAVATPR